MSDTPPPNVAPDPIPEPAAVPTAAVVAPGAQGVAAPLPSADPELDLETITGRPSYLFFGVVAALSLLADVASKAWAEVVLSQRTMLDPSITIIQDHLAFTLAYNKGGAWGLLQTASESVRKPFFLIVSVLAIAFIVSLYSRLAPGQRALKWGLPMVLGGALGNLSDRVTRSSVIDFIDYRADWIEGMNALIARAAKTWSVTDHWPTFNVADIFICIGVGLMAVDMVTSRRKPKTEGVGAEAPATAAAAAGNGAAPVSETPVEPVAAPAPEPVGDPIAPSSEGSPREP